MDAIYTARAPQKQQRTDTHALAAQDFAVALLHTHVLQRLAAMTLNQGVCLSTVAGVRAQDREQSFSAERCSNFLTLSRAFHITDLSESVSLVHDLTVEILDAVSDSSGGAAAARDLPPHIRSKLLDAAGVCVLLCLVWCMSVIIQLSDALSFFSNTTHHLNRWCRTC